VTEEHYQRAVAKEGRMMMKPIDKAVQNHAHVVSVRAYNASSETQQAVAFSGKPRITTAYHTVHSHQYPLGESNPCRRTENPMSWATRRRGRVATGIGLDGRQVEILEFPSLNRPVRRSDW
jgi:hypothetical protein